MNRSLMFPVLLVFLFLAGCSSQGTEESGVAGQVSQPFQQATGPEVHTISTGGMVLVNNTEFKIAEWGFAPIWGYEEPRGGAKYLWVHLISTNVGGVPQFTPYDFYVSYRGTNTSYITMDTRHGHSGYMDCRFCATNPNSLCDVCEFYPDTANDGYALFEVPEGLESGEATFVANLYGEIYEVQLNNPVPYEGQHISPINASFECELYDSPVGIGGERTNVIIGSCEHLDVTYVNDRHAPIIYGRDTFTVENLTINGVLVSQLGGSTYKVSVGSAGIAPFEEGIIEMNPYLTLRREEGAYFKSNDMVAPQGEEVLIEFDLLHRNGGVYGDVIGEPEHISMRATLPILGS